MSLALAAAVVLVPVALDDPLLSRADTFISEQAASAVAQGEVEQLHCLDLPENHPDGARACLTRTEWQAVFDHVRHEESVKWRERAMQLASWYSMGGQ